MGKLFIIYFIGIGKQGGRSGVGKEISGSGDGGGGEGLRWDKILRSRVQSPDGTTFYHFCSLRYWIITGGGHRGRGLGEGDTRAKPGSLLVIYKWASCFSLKYASNAQNTFVFYLGGSNLNISVVFLSIHTPLPVLAAILDFWGKWLFYRYFDINFTFLEYFHVKEVKCI